MIENNGDVALLDISPERSCPTRVPDTLLIQTLSLTQNEIQIQNTRDQNDDIQIYILISIPS